MDARVWKASLNASAPVVRARQSFLCRLCVSLICAVLFVVVVLLGLNAANQYPRFLAMAQQQQQNGIDVWENICGSGSIQRPSSLVRCADAHAAVNMVVRHVALEETIAAVLKSAETYLSEHIGNINPISWTLRRCGTETTCHYVLWKSLDAFTSSLWIMTLTSVCVCLGLFYCCYLWPLNGLQRLLSVRSAAMSKRIHDDAAVAIDTAGNTGTFLATHNYPLPAQSLSSHSVKKT